MRKEEPKTGYRTAASEVDGVETRAQKVRRQMLRHRYHSRKLRGRPRWGKHRELVRSDMETWEGKTDAGIKTG